MSEFGKVSKKIWGAIYHTEGTFLQCSIKRFSVADQRKAIDRITETISLSLNLSVDVLFVSLQFVYPSFHNQTRSCMSCYAWEN